MSTPRTDALLTALLDEQGFVDHANAPERWVKLARELEEELKAVTAERNEWARSFEVQGETAGPQQCKEWWDRNAFIDNVSGVIIAKQLHQENNTLKAELAALKSPVCVNSESDSPHSPVKPTDLEPENEISSFTTILFRASEDYKKHVQEFPTVEGREWSHGQKFIMAMAAQDGFAECARWMFKRWPVMIAGATTANKLTHIESTTNFRLSGFILRSKETNHAALIEKGAVRWLTDRECNALMHPHHPSNPPSEISNPK